MENVLVILWRPTCGACLPFKTEQQQQELRDAFKNANMNIKIVFPKVPIDENIWPSALREFSNLTPTIILIKGDNWKAAMARLGKENPIRFDTAVGLDMEIVGGKVTRPFGNRISININDKNEIIKWVRNANLKLEDKNLIITIPKQPQQKTIKTCEGIKLKARKLI